MSYTQSGMRTLLLVLALAVSASADEVVLRNGAVFRGVVTERDDTVVVEVDAGTMTFRRSEVRSIRRTADPIKELEGREAGAKTAPELFEVGTWAAEKGLRARAKELFERAVALDPDHEGARRALGYHRYEGRWVTKAELMASLGMVQRDGAWVSRETAEARDREETRLRIEAARQAAALKIAGMRRDVEMARLALERERLAEERRSPVIPYPRGLWTPLPRTVVVTGPGRAAVPPRRAAAEEPERTRRPLQLPPLPQRLPPAAPWPSPITPR